MNNKLLLLRTQENAEEFCKEFQQAGFATLLAPVISVIPLRPEPAYVATSLSETDIVVCLSQNAVKQLYFYQGQLNTTAQVWCVGAKTANKLAAYFNNIQVPQLESSEGLWQQLRAVVKPGMTVTFVKGVGGRDSLSSNLAQQGILVKELNLYKRVENVRQKADILATVDENQFNTAIIGSNALLDVACKWWPNLFTQLRVLVPSQRVAERAKQSGVDNVIVANGATAKHFLAILQDGKSA